MSFRLGKKKNRKAAAEALAATSSGDSGLSDDASSTGGKSRTLSEATMAIINDADSENIELRQQVASLQKEVKQLEVAYDSSHKPSKALQKLRGVLEAEKTARVRAERRAQLVSEEMVKLQHVALQNEEMRRELDQLREDVQNQSDDFSKAVLEADELRTAKDKFEKDATQFRADHVALQELHSVIVDAAVDRFGETRADVMARAPEASWYRDVIVRLSGELARHTEAVKDKDEEIAFMKKVVSASSAGGDAPDKSKREKPEKKSKRDKDKDKEKEKRPSEAVKFDTVMNSAVGVEAFMEFLKSEYSQETLMFWSAVEDYRRDPATDAKRRHANAQRVFDTFLAAGAALEVNIDEALKLAVKATIDKESPDASELLTVFDASQASVYQLLKTGGFQRFLKSEHCMGMVRKLAD